MTLGMWRASSSQVTWKGSWIRSLVGVNKCIEEHAWLRNFQSWTNSWGFAEELLLTGHAVLCFSGHQVLATVRHCVRDRKILGLTQLHSSLCSRNVGMKNSVQEGGFSHLTMCSFARSLPKSPIQQSSSLALLLITFHYWKFTWSSNAIVVTANNKSRWHWWQQLSTQRFSVLSLHYLHWKELLHIH